MKRRDILKWSASAGGLSLLAGKPSTASAALPVLKPTLPQKIDPISATLRRLELVGRQATYLWTESHINLAGVPMGAVVPATELPALEHQLKTIAKAIEAVTNFAASFATSALASGSLQSLDNLRTRLAGLQASFDQLLAANGGLLTLPAAVLSLLGTLTGTAGDIATQLKQIHHDLLSQGPLGALNGPKTVAQYDALFVTIEKPAISQLLHDNDLFAAMRVSGPNPMLIQRATALPAKFPLSDAQYRQVMGAGDSLADAAASGRLYLLDYEGLGDMAPTGPVSKPLTGTGYVCAPVALFARPKTGRSLVPVAIQCGQDPALNPIFLRVDDTANAGKPAEWNRGAYLVDGLGHCIACHGSRNSLGATETSRGLSGGLIAVENWYAPSLADPHEAGVADWPSADVVALLKTGVAPRGSVMGPMADVVFRSTQYLSDADLTAMASYLKDLPDVPKSEEPASAKTPIRRDAGTMARGAKIYDQRCAYCHGDQGQGAIGAYPPLAGNRAVNMARSTNLVQVIAHGGFLPTTAGNPRPYGMPPFGQTLDAAEVAAVLTYIRGSWGNDSAPVTQLDTMRR